MKPLLHADPLEVSTSQQPDTSIIWLHGLGADGYDFLPMVAAFRDPKLGRLRFVFPHAPDRAVTINGGAIMPAWYDIRKMQLEREIDDASIDISVKALDGWVDREVSRGVPEHRIVIAGFSQGGAVALDYATQTKRPLAGFVALSTYLPRPERLSSVQSSLTQSDQPKRRHPIFMGHGVQDGVVPLLLGEKSRDALKAGGFEPEWHTYRMEHSVSPEEVRDVNLAILRWLTRAL